VDLCGELTPETERKLKEGNLAVESVISFKESNK